MRNNHENTEASCALYALVVSAAAAALISLSGCGAVLGISKADLWGAKFDFTSGSDFHVGMNSIDHVDDHRGVNVKNERKY